MIISVTDEDKRIANILREKYSINISSFVRNKMRELYKSLNENDKSI